MKRTPDTSSNLRVIVATSVALVLLVATALGWLGWRLLSQEETLARQQTRNRLEQTADTLLASFNRRMTETDASLSQLGTALPFDAAVLKPQPPGTILVALSETGVEVQPAGQLLYYPVLPPPSTLDTEIFAEANKLQFQAGDLKAAAKVLTA